MLNIFKRHKNRPIDDGDDPLAIRGLLDQPALREVMTESEVGDLAADVPVSLDWSRLMAAGPIRFDSDSRLDSAA